MIDPHKTTVTIIGTGYVGLTTAVLFAQAGFKTYALDIDEGRLDSIRSGKSFFYEEGLDPLINESVNNGSLIPTNSYGVCIPESQFVFSCVGTPDKPDGSTNLDFIFQAAMSALDNMNAESVYVQKSTVPVGTGRKIEKLFLDAKKTIRYVSNPEFLREGSALGDSLYGDRMVFGGDNKEAVKAVRQLYEVTLGKRSEIMSLARLSVINDVETRYIETSLESAELIKVTANAFLALKISFANSIAKLADQTNADILEVMDAVGADKRIGGAFLNAGRGYGGGCFPKDVSGLISSAAKHGVDLAIMTAVSDVNASMPKYIANKLLHEFGSLGHKKIAVLGLSFKTGTSDARRSPGVALANILAHEGGLVKVFDPQANEEAASDLRREILLTDSIDEAIKGCDAVCIATDWNEFKEYNLETYAQLTRKCVFVDCMNVFDAKKVRSTGMKYIGVGRR